VNEDIVGYLQMHGERYTPHALRRRLSAAGFTADEIEEASAAVGEGGGGAASGAGGSSPPSRPEPGDGRRVRLRSSPRFWAGLVGYPVIIIGGGVGLRAISQDLAAIFLLGAIIGGIAFWGIGRESDRPLATGVGCGVLVAIGLPIILILGVLGSCLLTNLTNSGR